MKAEYGEFHHSEGEIKIFPENFDDLWHLMHLIFPGDLVYAITFRSFESASDKLRPEKVEKKPVRLGIRVEKVEFSQETVRLRAGGIIEHGADTGMYHTLNIEIGHEISLIKKWTSLEKERIGRAVRSSTAGLIHIVSVEEGEAQIYRMRQFGPQPVITILGSGGKRESGGSRELFFEEIRSALSSIDGPVVIAGPGFVKEELVQYLRRKDEDLVARVMVSDTRRTGRGAITEVIGQGILDRIADDLQLSREVSLIEELMARIAKEEPVAYGREEVIHAIDAGAAETLLVIDRLLREGDIVEILEKSERIRTKIVVFSSEFEPGVQLESLGGIAALLRFSPG